MDAIFSQSSISRLHIYITNVVAHLHVLSTLHILTHFIPTIILRGSYYYNPQIANEETEAQTG